MKALFNRTAQCIFLYLIQRRHTFIEDSGISIYKKTIQLHDYSFMACGAITFGTYVPALQVNLLLLSTRQNFMLLITN